MKESFTRALQGSLDTFLQGQRALVDAQRGLLQQLPYGAWNPFAAFAGQPPATPAAHSSDAAELERLRSEVSQTQALLRQLIVQQQAQPSPGPRGPAGKRPKRTRVAARG